MTVEPAPIEITTKALSIVEVNSKISNIGKTIEAAVTNATVEEPWAVFMTAAIQKGSIKPTGHVLIKGSIE